MIPLLSIIALKHKWGPDFHFTNDLSQRNGFANSAASTLQNLNIAWASTSVKDFHFSTFKELQLRVIYLHIHEIKQC